MQRIEKHQNMLLGHSQHHLKPYSSIIEAHTDFIEALKPQYNINTEEVENTLNLLCREIINTISL